MANPDQEINLINSILEVKASGIDITQEELDLPQGRTIAELLDDQEKTQK